MMTIAIMIIEIRERIMKIISILQIIPEQIDIMLCVFVAISNARYDVILSNLFVLFRASANGKARIHNFQSIYYAYICIRQ